MMATLSRDRRTVRKGLLLAWILCGALAGAAPALGQSRESDVLESNEVAPQQARSNSPWTASVTGDVLMTTTSATGAALGPGDLLEISVFDVPEMVQKARVTSNGTVSLHLIGPVVVEGLTPADAASLIRSKLVEGRFIKDPQVSVFVSEYAGQMATVQGEVNHPGAYPLLRSHRLADLIAVAGGFNNKAGQRVEIVRGDDMSRPIGVNLDDPDPSRRNPEVAAGDNITVESAGIIYVLGDVGRPGGFRLDRRTDVSAVEAVALAQGLLVSASSRAAEIIRTEGGERKEIPVDLKAALRSGGPDPLLHPGDILYVPSSLLHGMGRMSIQTVLATASGMAVYSTLRY
jgi:polysaccharide export outer membrane protein